MSKLTCDCGRPEGQHTRLSCGVPIPTHQEREVHERTARAALQLFRALKAMLQTHGAHGPCSRNSCSDCTHAYQMAVAAIRKAEGE